MSRRVDSAAALVVEERFAIVPEWLLDAEIGDAAVVSAPARPVLGEPDAGSGDPNPTAALAVHGSGD